ncbi:hypothetical protein BDV40DRAFT_300728 [Aspergillus tamarii]|uniref:Carrier domain-containing protein n=1 Tax=Aspergillus tamarii TaxID=41984 RepID=A0A5N6UTY7_ASPTM|nr:hypothetical protein BDV40DRAFT_300728 [Aspergillus tamarii]
MAKSQLLEGAAGWGIYTATFDHPVTQLKEDIKKLAWALVLRAYTGSDNIAFAYLNLNKPSSARDPMICRYILTGNDSLAAAIKHSTCKQRECDSQTANTLLWLDAPATSIDIQLGAEKLIYDMIVVPIYTKKSLSIAIHYTKNHAFSRLVPYITEAYLYAAACIGDNTATKISQVNLAGPKSIRQIETWNRGEPSSIKECVPEVVSCHPPTSAAICSSQETWTYETLDQYSTIVARELVRYGIVSETFVPLCFEKSPWAVVAMLAVHKAGGAFVPLDPNSPVDRLEGIIRQVNATVILGSERQLSHGSLANLRNRFQGVVAWVPVCHSAIASVRAGSPEPNGPCLDSAAYCMFTSGSTGKPKGVVVDHRALTHGLQKQGSVFGLSSSSRVYQNTPFTFDPSITEILGTLYHGGCICMPDDDARLQTPALVINELGANWAFLTPSYATTLDPTEVPGVRTLLLGGEAVTPHAIKGWTNNRRVINAYGPTECTIFSLSGDISLEGAMASNIGRPIGCKAYIADPEDYRKLCPVGAVGELLIQGPILARGYLNDTIKAGQAFVKSPAWGSDGSQRSYRTGDTARYTADGTIDYIGRRDKQIKINGQRLELGEIENCISQQCDSTDVVVDCIMRAGVARGQVLVAFISFREATNDTLILTENRYLQAIDRLAEYVRRHLPLYMVPHIFIALSHVPLSASGKIDRMSLQRLATECLDKRVSEKKFDDNTQISPTEHIVRKAWSSILNIPESTFSMNDIFFQFGDSMSAIKLVRELHKYHLELAFHDLLLAPKLCEMVANVHHCDPATQVTMVRERRLSGFQSTLVREEAAHKCGIDSNLVENIYPCTPFQEGLMALVSLHPFAYNGHYVFQLCEKVNIRRFQNAWELVLKLNPILRTRIIATGRRQSFTQVVLRGLPGWRYFPNLEEAVESHRALHASLEENLTWFSIVPAHGQSPAYFIWTVHHSLYDGYSFDMILNDVQQAYNGISLKPHAPFVTFVEYATREMSQTQLYWEETLGDFTTGTYPTVPNQHYCSYAEKSIRRHFNIQKRPATARQSVILQAAWAMTYSYYVESSDVVFGAVLSGRHLPVQGIDDIAAPTLNTVPLRLFVDGTKTVSEFLFDVQRSVTNATRFQAIGMQRLQRLSPGAQNACKMQCVLVIQPPQPERPELFANELHDLSIEHVYGYSLVLYASLCPDGSIGITVHFDPNRISEAQVQRLLGQWEFATRQLGAANMDQKLSAIPAVSQSDVEQLLEWNARCPPIEKATIHALIERQAMQHPQKEPLYG